MRSLTLAKGGWNKIRSHHKDLKHADIEDSLKSLPPGEWCFLGMPGQDDMWVGLVNPLIEEKYTCIQVVHDLKKSEINTFNPEAFVVQKLKQAYEKRLRFKGYSDGARLFYGSADGLPGLIIDAFKNIAIIQINTAGIDRYRELIQVTVADLIKGKVYFLDNPKYREKEFLPSFDNEPIPAIEVTENGLTYSLRAEVIQKVGFYYDHRENRNQLRNLLSRLDRNYKNAVDLFCYVGAWGMNALLANVEHVDFVDQGDFSTDISDSLKKNGFSDKGNYHRGDVFKFLDAAIGTKKYYDLILCDPPAFAKSHLQKDQALEGYSKLHRKVFKIAASGSVLAFSSCTHYVSHDEFQKNILDAANKENKKIQLLYSGIQGWDHPVTSLNDRSNYIKSYFYLME